MRDLACIWIFIVILIVGLVEFDKCNKNQLYISVNVESDCNYILPKDYSLVQDSITSEYAIQYSTRYSKYYLSLTRFLLAPNHISIYGDTEEAIVFKDSCNAKGFTREYFESIERTKKFIKVK